MRRVLVGAVILVTVGMGAWSWWSDARRPPVPITSTMPIIPSTTRRDLTAAVEALEKRLAERPDDGDAVVRLAEMLIRIQRVDGNPGAVIKAEQRLRDFLVRTPGHYEAQRALGPVLLSQHRFRDALREAHRARAIDPRDAWNYGVIGDAHLELGEYEDAFAAFDRMGALRPGPAAYARVAYALEIQGDLDGALENMRMSAEGTSAHDAEGQAWHYAQLGNLLLQKGRLGDARREFERAAFTFPDHPYATIGLARIKLAGADFVGALAMYERMYRRTPSPELAFVIGDLYARLPRPNEAERMYVEGERLEREGWATEEPQPQALARFLAERGRKIPEAIALAEEAAAKRRDVHTMDALAWAYFKGDRIEDAYRASKVALRTGTRDARILRHAAAILLWRGDGITARALRDHAAERMPEAALVEANAHGVDVQNSPNLEVQNQQRSGS
jgi:tetratricopeptide (TPR) repeat protein